MSIKKKTFESLRVWWEKSRRQKESFDWNNGSHETL